jgi:flavin-dependent dehydrogenase
MIAIKRIVMDEKIAKAAKNAGAKLTENTTVENASFLEDEGLWKVDCLNPEGKDVTYYARALVCADGSPSSLARKLGYVKTEPEGVCSRAYVKDNTLFNCDGLIFYPKRLLPGYCAIIREAGNELNFCTYIIPGGVAKNEDLPRLHDEIMKRDPYVSKLLGPDPNIERMKSASLRLGGIPKSYGQHLVIIGDAAGFIDPLTGGKVAQLAVINL